MSAYLDSIPYNVPILSIPAYYVLAFLTHAFAVHVATKGNLAAHDNRNPKSTTYHEGLRKRLSPREFALFERAESCHRNHLENLPLYAATVLAALFAESKTGVDVGLQTFVLAWMTIRVLYTANYLTAESNLATLPRSALYTAGTGWAITVLVKSAHAIGN